MKLLIVALNSKYTHTSLSARCLYGAVKNVCDAHFAEYTVNDNLEDVIADIYRYKPDCVAFSCYIWNISQVLRISSVLKAVSSDINIVLGGHEAEHDAQGILKNNAQIDAILHGEGEISLRNYVDYFTGNKDLSSLSLITYRKGNDLVTLPPKGEVVDLNEQEFVYGDDISELGNKIIYYETSRGCPYNCTYCISGESRKVRYLDVERVKRELKFFMDRKVPLVKLVDRTFNSDVARAKEIFSFIADNPSDTCFHMELSGALLDAETLNILSRAKKGSMQFEIGVQTTNAHTLRAIQRSVSFEKLKNAVKELMNMGNIHIHLDLIAGLPEENAESFKKSFDEVMALRPHVLQLGFLKMLKGSQIRREGDKYGYLYRDYPPYEVISNNFISYEELMELKEVEEALDKYYNSGNFKYSADYLFEHTKSPYEIFLKLGKCLANGRPIGFAYSIDKLFDMMYECFSYLGDNFINQIKIDYLSFRRTNKRPSWMGAYNKDYMDFAYELLKDEDFKCSEIPLYYGVPAKEIMKHIHSEKVGDRLLLFDYKEDNVYDVTGYWLQQ